MRNRSIWLAAAAALVLALPARAMNKCVDANGKVTYQQDPCPGNVVRGSQALPPKPKAAAPAAPAAAEPPKRTELEELQASDPVHQKFQQMSRQTCARLAKDIAEAQALLPQLSGEKRDKLDRAITKAELDYGKRCSR